MKNDGGLAFPMPDQKYPGMPAGMSLRDYFAAAALTGFLTHPDAVGEKEEAIAAWAYSAADAMIAERIK